MFTPSKQPFGKNATTREHLHTGTGLSVSLPNRYTLTFVTTNHNFSFTDAADVYGSTLFQDNSSTSGLGGWGDPSNDFQVPAGGFSDFKLSYPSPHTLRRNFTLQPYLQFAGSEFFTDPTLLANSTFTQAEVDKMVNGTPGDFKGFQKYLESWEVHLKLLHASHYPLADPLHRVPMEAYI